MDGLYTVVYYFGNERLSFNVEADNLATAMYISGRMYVSQTGDLWHSKVYYVAYSINGYTLSF